MLLVYLQLTTIRWATLRLLHAQKLMLRRNINALWGEQQHTAREGGMRAMRCLRLGWLQVMH